MIITSCVFYLEVQNLEIQMYQMDSDIKNKKFTMEQLHWSALPSFKCAALSKFKEQPNNQM